MSNKPEKKGYVLEGGAMLNAGYFHEILDRGNLICGMIDDYLIEHPGMTLEMNKKCEAAQQLLCEVTNLSCAEQDRIFGADLAKPSEWISAQLPPKDSSPVLARYRENQPFVAKYIYLNWYDDQGQERDLSHWCEIPELTP